MRQRAILAIAAGLVSFLARISGARSNAAMGYRFIRTGPAPAASKTWALGIAAAAVLLSWCLFWLASFCLEGNLAERGQWGDSFGALNALFSGLAFAGLIGALLLQSKQLEHQRQELALQREELKLTREEMERSTKAQQQSGEALRVQGDYLAKSAQAQALAALAQLRSDTLGGLAEATWMLRSGVTKAPIGRMADREFDQLDRVRAACRQAREVFLAKVYVDLLGAEAQVNAAMSDPP